MRINNFYNNKPTYSPSPTQNKPPFKGYIACPIKELHIQTFNSYESRYPIIEELNRKCGQYFRIIVQTFEGFIDAANITPKKPTPTCPYKLTYNEHGQDNKLFTENGILLLEGCAKDGWEEAETLAQYLDLPTRHVKTYVQGGNCFLGKKPDGETFALVGQDALKKKRYGPRPYEVEKTDIDKNRLAEELGLHPDNVYVLPQPEYHLDMAIRPLKYPYVLVDSPQKTIELTTSKKLKAYLLKLQEKLKGYTEEENYTSPELIAERLEEMGFKPIFVPGTIGMCREETNFMNAIVHQKPDGSLVYITNHSKGDKKFWKGSDMEEVFTQYLREQCPDISEVIFIDGKGEIDYCLRTKFSGIHCLASERPDVEQWNRMLK